VPPDPIQADRLRDQLATLRQLRHAAEARAAHPPRLTTDAWRGDAHAAYAITADELAAELAALAAGIARVERLTRTELAHALA